MKLEFQITFLIGTPLEKEKDKGFCQQSIAKSGAEGIQTPKKPLPVKRPTGAIPAINDFFC